MISHCEAFKHDVHLFIINTISILTILELNKDFFIDAAVYSEHGKVIKCNFKPGSFERSIDLEKKGIRYTSAAGIYLNSRQSIKMGKFIVLYILF
jgi:hypothetical protein